MSQTLYATKAPPPPGQLQLYSRGDQPKTRPLADLVYLQANANYTWLHWTDGQRLLISRTLKHYAHQLPSEWFVRLHRNALINLHYLERLEYTNPRAGGWAYLSTGVIIHTSRRALGKLKDVVESDRLPTRSPVTKSIRGFTGDFRSVDQWIP